MGKHGSCSSKLKKYQQKLWYLIKNSFCKIRSTSHRTNRLLCIIILILIGILLYVLFNSIFAYSIGIRTEEKSYPLGAECSNNIVLGEDPREVAGHALCDGFSFIKLFNKCNFYVIGSHENKMFMPKLTGSKIKDSCKIHFFDVPSLNNTSFSKATKATKSAKTKAVKSKSNAGKKEEKESTTSVKEKNNKQNKFVRYSVHDLDDLDLKISRISENEIATISVDIGGNGYELAPRIVKRYSLKPCQMTFIVPHLKSGSMEKLIQQMKFSSYILFAIRSWYKKPGKESDEPQLQPKKSTPPKQENEKIEKRSAKSDVENEEEEDDYEEDGEDLSIEANDEPKDKRNIRNKRYNLSFVRTNCIESKKYGAYEFRPFWKVYNYKYDADEISSNEN